jgi:hypothetical protein
MSDSTIATREEMHRALERWAFGRGCLNTASTLSFSPIGWALLTDGRLTVHRKGRTAPWYPDLPTALVWAIAVEANLPPVDVGRCPACVARSGRGKLATMVWASAFAELEADANSASNSLQTIVRPRVKSPDSAAFCSRWCRAMRAHGWIAHEDVAYRPCPQCDGTGRDVRDVASMVLDAERPAAHFLITVRAVGEGAWRVVAGGVPYPPVAVDHNTSARSLGELMAREMPMSVEVYADGSIGFFARAPVHVEHPQNGGALVTCIHAQEGDAIALAALPVISDNLQGTAQPLGTLLALALRWWWSAEPSLQDTRLAVAAVNKAFWDRERIAFFARAPQTDRELAWDVLRTALAHYPYDECAGWTIKSLSVERDENQPHWVTGVGDRVVRPAGRERHVTARFDRREGYTQLTIEAKASAIVVIGEQGPVERFAVAGAWVTARTVSGSTW